MRTLHFVDPMSLSSAGPLWEYPGNSLISSYVNARIVYGGVESLLGMSRHPQGPGTVHQTQSEMFFHSKNGGYVALSMCGTDPKDSNVCIMHN